MDRCRLSRCWTALLASYGAQHLQYYDLQAFVVIANPVHLLARPRVSPSRFLQTGTRSESDARTHGPAILAGGSYDHSVCDDRESDRIKAYIENNPVKAGLVASSLVERGKKSREESNLI